MSSSATWRWAVPIGSLLLSTCGPGRGDETSTDAGSGGTSTATGDGTSPTGGEEETGAIDCDAFLDQPVSGRSVTITIRNERDEPIALRGPTCSEHAFAVEGPDASSYPFVAFEFACETHVEHGLCHPYAAPDGCPPSVVAVLEPGQEFIDAWDTSMYHTRAMPEACRGVQSTFSDDPAACAECKQQAPALDGPHELVVRSWVDLDCDGGKCTVSDYQATIEARLDFVPTVQALAVALK